MNNKKKRKNRSIITGINNFKNCKLTQVNMQLTTVIYY